MPVPLGVVAQHALTQTGRQREVAGGCVGERGKGDGQLLAFDLAEKYRTLAFVILDGAIGQMMEPAELPEMRPLPEKRPAWAVTGAKGRPHNVISSLFMGAEQLEEMNIQLQAKLRLIEQAGEVRYESFGVDDAEIVAKVKASGANVLLVALGFPRQELWLSRHGVACGVQVGIGVGGTFDVLAGRVQRAPQIFQKLGLEWFYRLCCEPKRIKRMIKLPAFLFTAIGARLRHREDIV